MWVKIKAKEFMDKEKLARATEEEREVWEYGKIMKLTARPTKQFPGPHVEVRWESDYTRNWFLESHLLEDELLCEAPPDELVRRWKETREAKKTKSKPSPRKRPASGFIPPAPPTLAPDSRSPCHSIFPPPSQPVVGLSVQFVSALASTSVPTKSTKSACPLSEVLKQARNTSANTTISLTPPAPKDGEAAQATPSAEAPPAKAPATTAPGENLAETPLKTPPAETLAENPQPTPEAVVVVDAQLLERAVVVHPSADVVPSAPQSDPKTVTIISTRGTPRTFPKQQPADELSPGEFRKFSTRRDGTQHRFVDDGANLGRCVRCIAMEKEKLIKRAHRTSRYCLDCKAHLCQKAHVDVPPNPPWPPANPGELKKSCWDYFHEPGSPDLFGIDTRQQRWTQKRPAVTPAGGNVEAGVPSKKKRGKRY